MDDTEMERQLSRLSPDLRELVSKVRSGDLPASVITDLVAELEDLGRSDAQLSAALDRLYELEQRRTAT